MRSISDSLRLKVRRDSLKDRDLVELVRLCGSSLLYLPAEYAASSLTLPTCIRATAQYLIQHGILEITFSFTVSRVLIDVQLLPPVAYFVYQDLNTQSASFMNIIVRKETKDILPEQ